MQEILKYPKKVGLTMDYDTWKTTNPDLENDGWDDHVEEKAEERVSELILTLNRVLENISPRCILKAIAGDEDMIEELQDIMQLDEFDIAAIKGDYETCFEILWKDREDQLGEAAWEARQDG